MPPKPKFTRDEIVQAALTIVSEKGIEARRSWATRSALPPARSSRSLPA